MRRGEIWTVLGKSYASKPRPVLIVQSDLVDSFESTVLCLVTSSDSSEIPTRVRVEPTPENGLRETSWIMTDKLYSARKGELGQRIGMLDDESMGKVTRQLAAILGIPMP